MCRWHLALVGKLLLKPVFHAGMEVGELRLLNVYLLEVHASPLTRKMTRHHDRILPGPLRSNAPSQISKTLNEGHCRHGGISINIITDMLNFKLSARPQ